MHFGGAGEPSAVHAGVLRRLKPEGRLVIERWTWAFVGG
jgi:hypothetical protein